MIPTDDNNDTYRFKQTFSTVNYATQSLSYKYEESKCDKPLLAQDVYMRWLSNENFANLTKKQLQLAAYTGYSLMYQDYSGTK